jgi:hypothetical protein
MHEPVELQQPLGQLLAEHEPDPLLLPLPLDPLPELPPDPLPLLLLLESQTPLRQRVPVAVQSRHAAPIVPHCVLDVEATHCDPLQQPAHELGPQAPPLPDPEPVEPSLAPSPFEPSPGPPSPA